MNRRVIEAAVAERGLLGIEEIGNKEPSEVRLTCLEKCFLLKVPFDALKVLPDTVRLKAANKALAMRANIKREMEATIAERSARASSMVNALKKIDSSSQKLKIAVKDMQKNILNGTEIGKTNS